MSATPIRHLFRSDTVLALQKGMEGTLLRTRVSMNNLANVDTPGFKRQTVAFEDQLRRALRQGAEWTGRVEHPRHIPVRGAGNIEAVQPLLVTDTRSSFRADGNNVDIDQEMVAITAAAGRNVRMTELLSRTYQDLRNVIRERI